MALPRIPISVDETAIGRELKALGDLRPIFPPVFRRVLGFQFGLMRPVFPERFAMQIHWAWCCLAMNVVGFGCSPPSMR
jgi:hypothetical protein